MSETKRCPFCDELIRANARKCKHCGSMLDGSTPAPRTTGDSAASGGATLSPGTVVSQYEIRGVLGQGGMGVVYEAVHQYTEQRVALKAVWPNLMMDETSRRRFLEEGRTMARLKHGSIVTLHNFFEEQGSFYLAMEYIEGRPLEDVLEGHGKKGTGMPIEAAVSITKQVAEALGHAHGQELSIVHRDIKPSNIMIQPDGRAIVMDFGIAKAVGREKLTRTRGVVGTYEYMSPEQVVGGDVSPATDVYSLGIVLYEMLTGRVPFPQKTETGIEAMDSHRFKEPPSISDLRPDVPGWLVGVVEKCLAKKPSQRFENGMAVARALYQQEPVNREKTPEPTAVETAPVTDSVSEPTVDTAEEGREEDDDDFGIDWTRRRRRWKRRW